MNSKNLISAGAVTMLLLGALFSVSEFTSSNEVNEGVMHVNNESVFNASDDTMAILYGKPTCPYCKQAVKELDRQGIKYVYKNIKSSPEALNEFAALKGNAIPLLITRKLRITGFQPEWYSESVLNGNELTSLVLLD